MFRRISTPTTPLSYAEIAGSINFAGLQRDLRSAARLTIVGTGLSSGVMVGLVVVAFMLGLSGMTFALTGLAAGGIAFAFAILGTLRLTKYKQTWATLDSIVHEEWRTGVSVLPDWFAVPRMYHRLRKIPELGDGQFRKLRRANLIFSERFQVASLAIILICTVLGIALAFQGLTGIVLALPLLISGLVIVGLLASAGRNVSLLHELRAYEKVTGRTVLPADLRDQRSPANR